MAKPTFNTVRLIAKYCDKTVKEIREKTPYSFRILVNKLQIFKPRSRRLKELYEKYDTEKFSYKFDILAKTTYIHK